MIKNKYTNLIFLCSSLGIIIPNTSLAVTLPAGTKLAQNQHLSYAISSTPESLDPGLDVNWNIQQVQKSVFDTLVRQDNTGAIVGVGAVSWETSSDGLTWIFHLRPEATWSDGQTVTAYDYVYAWQRVIDPKTASLGADFIAALNLLNTSAIQKGELAATKLGVYAKDKFTLVLHLSKPTPWLLDTLSMLPTAPIRQDLIEKYGDKWTRAENIVSNGPYKLVHNKFNDNLLFTLRDDYWDRKNIYITSINYQVLPSGQSSYLKYLAGEFYTARVPAQYMDQALKERPQEIIAEPYPSTYALVINNRLEKFKDLRVRQAMNLLIDRDFIAQKFYKFYTPTTTVAPSILDDGQLQLEQSNLLDPQERAQNIQKAIALLDAAGYTSDKPLEITWLYTKGRDADRNNLAMSSMLSEFSQGRIKVSMQAADRTTYYYRVQKHDFDVAFYILNSDFYHVASFYNNFNATSSNNYSGWSSPTFTALYELAYNTKDNSQRRMIYQQLNQILQQEVPVIPILLSARVIVKSPALGGFNGKLPFTYMRDYYIIADKKIAPVK